MSGQGFEHNVTDIRLKIYYLAEAIQRDADKFPQCVRLAAIPSISVSLPNTTAYASTLSNYWSLQEASLAPSCIAHPKSTTSLSSLISALADYHSSCSFAIKSHGHAPAAGFANIASGLTIDLTSLNTITTNEDASVAHIGTGASWLDAYAFLDPLNKTVSGGRNGRVGVGGLTLGGGISYFSPQVGFTADSAVNFEVILGSGAIVYANATSHPKLFRALKGGGNNFGIVTRIDFKTLDLPQGEVLGGRLIHDIKYRDDVFYAFAGIAGARAYDVHASITTSVIYNAATTAWTLLSAPIYTKPEPKPSVYAPLVAIPTISNTLGVTQLHVLANESAIPQTNQLFQTGTYGVDAKLLARISDLANETLSTFHPSGSMQWILTFEPLPAVFVARGAGKNVLGTTPASGNSVILLLSASWSDNTASETVYGKAEELMGKINKAAQQMGLLKEFVYANYGGRHQRPFESYGKANYQFLKKVAGRYDPKGMFQKQVPGGFKLGLRR